MLLHEAVSCHLQNSVWPSVLDCNPVTPSGEKETGPKSGGMGAVTPWKRSGVLSATSPLVGPCFLKGTDKIQSNYHTRRDLCWEQASQEHCMRGQESRVLPQACCSTTDKSLPLSDLQNEMIPQIFKDV